MTFPTELPYCQLKAGVDTLSGSRYPRAFYKKPTVAALPKCTIPVKDMSGVVDVYVQQSSMESGSVSVMIDGELVKVCGGKNPFTNGYAGEDGECQNFALCYSGPVSSGSSIVVTPLATLRMNRCASSLAVLVNMSTVDATTKVYVPPPTPAFLNVTAFSSRTIATTQAQARIFVGHADRAALNLVQGAYSCAGRTCPDHIVEVASSAGSCQRCGGTANFLGGQSGYSDRCDRSQFCGSGMVLNSGGDASSGSCLANGAGTSHGPYTGFVTVAFNATAMVAKSESCHTPSGTIHVSASNSSSGITFLPVFPFQYAEGALRPLIAVPATDAATRASHSDAFLLSEAVRLTKNVSASRTARLTTIDVFGNPQAAFYVGMSKNAQGTLDPNVSIACLLDHSGGKGVICEIPVPRYATHVDVKVSQTVYADATITIEGVVKGKTTYTSVCGKDAQFGKFPAASDRCNLFLSCSKRHLYTNDTLANNTDGVIRVTFPSNVGTACELEGAVIATFTDQVTSPDTTCNATTEFQCGNQERKCIPFSNVCDYIQDCEDGSDESACLNWKPLAEDGITGTLVGDTIKLTNFNVSEYPGVNTFQGCRLRAAMARTIAFTITNTTCSLYERAVIQKVFKTISNFIEISENGEQTYIQVQADGGDSMDMCISGVHCNGNGFVVYGDDDDEFTRPPCTCECNADSFGARCSESASLGATGKLEFGFAVADASETSDLSISSFRSALLEALGSANVACDPRIVMTSASHAAMRCLVSSVAGTPDANKVVTTAALSTDTITVVNLWLHVHYFHSPVAYAIPTNVIASEATCNATAGTPCLFDVSGDVVDTNITGNVSVSKSGRSKLAKGLLFEVSDDAFAAAITIVLEGPASAPGSSSRRARREITCTPTVTSNSGCKISTCILNQTEIQGMKSAYISNVSLTGVQDAAYDQCTSKKHSARVVQEGVAPLSPSSFNPDSEVTDYQAFLIIGALVIAAGCGISLLLALVFCCCHARALGPYQERSEREASELRSMELKILGHVRYYEVEPDNRAWDNHAIRAGLAFAVLLIVGVFLILFYFTSYDRDSNYAPLVEEYPDSNCDNSAFAFVPKRSFYISKNNTICKQQEVTGESSESAFAKGRCEGTSVANVRAVLQAGVSLTKCQDASETTWTADQCLPIQTLLPSVTRATYIKVRCAEAAFVEERVQALGLVAGTSSLSDEVLATAVSPDLAIAHFGANGAVDGAPGSRVFSFPYLQGQTVRTSTSMHPVRVASHGDMSGFDGNADGIRLVGQNADSFAPAAGSSTIKAAFEDKYQSTMDRLVRAELSGHIPTDIAGVADQPIGYVLNGFTDTADGTSGTAASKNALRYYGMRRTPFDLGAYFPQDVELEDGMGLTMSMYVRARSTTRGFIFAVTDVVENAVTNENYLLTKLWDMILNAQPASRWYTNTSYSVYSSLFLNGPSKTLTFAYVDSSLPAKLHHSASEREELVTMEWSLENLGLTRLLNGDWHAVTIALRVENEKLKATLGVDGETSYSAEGWSNCVPRFPSPIKEIPIGASMPTKDSSEDVVKPGGELMVGYMNGGVYAFTVRTEVISPDTLLLEDTQAARDFDDYPRDDLQILAGVLFFFGMVGILVVVVVTVPEVAKTGAEESKAQYRSAAVEFYVATLPLTHFGIEDAARAAGRAKDDGGDKSGDEVADKYEPIRFNTALRLTNCTVGAFQALLDDISSQSTNPGLAILAVIYHAHNSEPDFTIKAPMTPAEWNAMVRDDEQDQVAKDAKRCCGKPPAADENGNQLTLEAEEDIEMCSGNVFYQGGEFLKGVLSGMSNNHDGVEGGGAGEGLGEGVGIETGGGTSSMQQSTTSSSSGGTMASSFLDLFAPVIVVFQSAFVWITSIGLPGDYTDMFGSFFSFLSVDFVNAFPNLPTLLTPLMQLAAGLILLTLLVYLLLQDRRTFDFNLVRYVHRRDTLEGTKPERAEAAESLGEDLHAIDDRAVPLPEFNLVTLSLAESRRVDYFSRVADVPDGLQARFGSLPDDDATDITLADGSTLPVTRGSKKAQTIYDTDDNKMLTNIPTMCQLHPTRRLCPAIQTKVYPYSCPPSCAVVINGQRCGNATGTMFTCGYHDPQVDGSKSVCTYAICQDHMVLKPLDLAKAHAVGTLRMLKERGFWWILTALLLTIAHALYTPVLKTAMMVASCHPFYQCEFKQCWADPDQKFIIAAFLAITLIVLFGIGVPLIELVVLMGRGRKLGLAFHGKEYKGRYDEEQKSTTALIFKKITGKPLLQVKYLEWSRFLETDFSRMAVTYKVVKFSALFVPPLLVAYKVAVVAPAVLLEAGSLDQRIAISAVELLFSVIMFATNAFITPFVTLTFRVASIHQLFVLGMSAASAVYKYDTGKDLGTGIIAITFIYIIFNVVVLVLTVIWPILTVLLAKRRAKKLVTEHGYEYSQGMALWVDPIAHDAELKEIEDALNAPSDFGHKEADVSAVPNPLSTVPPSADDDHSNDCPPEAINKNSAEKQYDKDDAHDPARDDVDASFSDTENTTEMKTTTSASVSDASSPPRIRAAVSEANDDNEDPSHDLPSPVLVPH